MYYIILYNNIIIMRTTIIIIINVYDILPLKIYDSFSKLSWTLNV